MTVQPTGTVTLLFSDIEGSTRLLHRLGRDSYSELLDAHRRILREVCARRAGYEVDSEGDSMFMAFRTAADAVAAAGETQRAIAAQQWPNGEMVRVRIGIHTGEPLAAPPKYVGLDVHRAARIMAASNGGQVLLSDSTERLLAGDERALDAFSLADLGPWRLKDFDRPVRLYQLGGEGLHAVFPPVRAERVAPRRRRHVVASCGAAVVVVVGAIIVVSRGGGDGLEAPPNSLAVIDAERNKLMAAVPVGVQPGPVAFGGGTVLVANLADRTLSRIDPAASSVERTIPFGEVASEIVFKSSFWIALGHPLRVSRLDYSGDSPSLTATFHNPCAGCSRSFRLDMERRDREFGASGVALGDGSLWAVGAVEAASPNPESALMRVDPATGRIVDTLDWEADTASGLAVGNGAVWIAARGDNAVWRISTRTTEVLEKVTVGKEPSDVAFGHGSAWVTTQGDDLLWRLDAREGRPATVSEVIEVGAQPSAVVVMPEAVWVTNRGDGTVSRVDPRTNKVVATIAVGNAPSEIAAGGGRVWVTVQPTQP